MTPLELDALIRALPRHYLKSCPECGGPARVMYEKGHVVVYCECGQAVRRTSFQEAVFDWNRI